MILNAAYIQRLAEARAGLETLLPRVDRDKPIYPNWKIKEVLDHITGWDEIVVDTLVAHLQGRPPSISVEKGIDEYNLLSIQKRAGLTYEDSFTEFTAIRLQVTEIIRLAPEQKLSELISVPWGGKTTVSEFLEIFAHHEEEHSTDLLQWLASSDNHILEARK